MTDLLPCPKCGAQPLVDYGLSNAPYPKGEEFISCATVFVGEPGIPIQACGVWAVGPVAWNRRAPVLTDKKEGRK